MLQSKNKYISFIVLYIMQVYFLLHFKLTAIF